MMTTKEPAILLVDDDEIDIEGVIRTFRKARVTNPIVAAGDGKEALKILRKEEDIPRPYIILLDINMPRMNGLEFLE